MSSEQKNYLGKGWENGQYNLINLKISKEKLAELPTDDYGNISITVARLREPDSRSKATHTVFENTYSPNRANRSEERTEITEPEAGDLPF